MIRLPMAPEMARALAALSVVPMFPWDEFAAPAVEAEIMALHRELMAELAD